MQATRFKAGSVAVIVAVLLAAHFLLAYSSAKNKSVTYDEPYHLTVGYLYWHTGDFRMSYGKPPLPSLLVTNPLVTAPTTFPNFNSDNWYKANLDAYAKDFLYETGNDLDRMLLRSRCVMAVVSVLLGLSVFIISRSIFGLYGGLLSLAMYTFSPTMIAHARLVTLDLMVSAFFLWSTWAVWKCFQKLTWVRLIGASVALAGVFLSKLTSIFIILVVCVLAVARVIAKRPFHVRLLRKPIIVESWFGRLRIIAIIIVVHVSVVYAGIWAAYGFRYDTFVYNISGQERLGQPYKSDSTLDPWQVKYKDRPKLKAVVEFCRDYRLFPEMYLYTVLVGAQVTGSRSAFLDGDVSATGFKRFFPLAFVYKTPTPFLAILVCAIVATFSRWCAIGHNTHDAIRSLLNGLYHTAPLWALLVIYWLVAINSTINIGHRHILPAYPPLIILAGACLAERPKNTFKIILSTLAALLVIGTLWIHPHYLANFNILGGGPSRGYRHLVDSSLDWGQDLIHLRNWLRKNADGQNVFLAYFGNAPPRRYGLSVYALPYELQKYNGYRGIGTASLTGGTYCISATLLQQVYSPDERNWSKGHEKEYRELESRMSRFENVLLGDEQTLRTQVFGQGSDFVRSFVRFQNLRFAKLCAYLLAREPNDHVGYSILIYELSEDEIQEALAKPG